MKCVSFILVRWWHHLTHSCWIFNQDWSERHVFRKNVKFQNVTGLPYFLSDFHHFCLFLPVHECPHCMPPHPSLLSKKKYIEWMIHSIYGVKKFHSLRSEYHSILTPVEWKFTSQWVESRLVHSIFTPKEVIILTLLPIREWRQRQIEWKFTLFFREYPTIL